MDSQPLYNIRILDLKIVSFSIEDEPEYKVGDNFNFTINVDHIIHERDETIQVNIGVIICEPQEENITLARLQTALLFQVANLKEILSSTEKSVPENLRLLLYGTSISTTRGLLFSSLKSTYLQHAILPTIDARSMKQEQENIPSV